MLLVCEVDVAMLWHAAQHSRHARATHTLLTGGFNLYAVAREDLNDGLFRQYVMYGACTVDLYLEWKIPLGCRLTFRCGEVLPVELGFVESCLLGRAQHRFDEARRTTDVHVRARTEAAPQHGFGIEFLTLTIIEMQMDAIGKLPL